MPHGYYMATLITACPSLPEMWCQCWYGCYHVKPIVTIFKYICKKDIWHRDSGVKWLNQTKCCMNSQWTTSIGKSDGLTPNFFAINKFVKQNVPTRFSNINNILLKRCRQKRSSNRVQNYTGRTFTQKYQIDVYFTVDVIATYAYKLSFDLYLVGASACNHLLFECSRVPFKLGQFSAKCLLWIWCLRTISLRF